MNELARMNSEIRKISLAMMFVIAGASIFIWQGQFSTITAGIIIGTMTGLIGYQMINTLTSQIENAQDPKAKGRVGYMIRYMLYTIIFVLCVYRGIQIFALFAGMLCHKLAIVIYVFLHRKEVD